MTTFKINGKDYDLHFGAAFSQALSKEFKMTRDVQGAKMDFGLGVRMAVPYLEMGDVDAIFKVLKHSLWKYKVKPTDNELYEAIEEVALETGGFDDVADILLEGLRDSGFYNKLFEETEQEKEKAKKAQEK